MSKNYKNIPLSQFKRYFKRIAPRVANDEVRMVSQILWRQADLKGKRSSSEGLCKVDELCDHLKDMKFEDVHKVEENSKVKTRQI